MKNKILVIAAHPDDEIIGIGGTVAKHINSGDECFAIILGEGMTSRYDSRKQAEDKKVQELHKDVFEASKIVGYNNTFLENLPDNRFDSVDLLDIIKIIEMYIDKIGPNIIYTHHYGDLNVDHRRTYEAVLTATRPLQNQYVKEVYCFETVSSTEWNFEYTTEFKPNYFVDVTQTLDTKLKAMYCYKSEIRSFPHPRSIENLELNAKKWGSVVGMKYAEAFEVVRIIK